MTAERFDVAVIGAGANGLVASAALGRAGLKVVLLERGDTVGGQGRAVEFAPGFRAAPLGIDPGWLPERVARGAGIEPVDRAAADVPLSVMVDGGKILMLSRHPKRASEAIRAYSAADAAKWAAFTALLRTMAGFLEGLYQRPAPDVDARSPSELRPLLGAAWKFRALGRANMIEFLHTMPLSVWELTDDWFEFAPLKAAVAAGGIQDYQQGPRSGGTGFVLLHHLVGAPGGAVRGRVPWRAGPDAFVEAAEKAARRSGVTVRTGARVSRIGVGDDAVQGVTLESGDEIDAGAILSTADPARTLLDWVDPVWLDPEFLLAVRNIRRRACTAFVLYALDRILDFPGPAPSNALAGLVSLTADLESLERAADCAKYGRVAEKPHIELTVPTITWPHLAPGGKHVLVARVQYAPYHLREGDAWDSARRDALADRVTAAIGRVASGFESRILHRVAWTPGDLSVRFGLHEGSLTQGELGLDQILFMRPVAGRGDHTTPIAGLYLGGSGTHPGPGILGGPGWLAARRILADRGRANRSRGRAKGSGGGAKRNGGRTKRSR
ncbi:MAG: NAD(P)/FAD-dependent oxidoreductase [Candidatus Latescibacteria bacterium]|nr:NAD(P)/FAD-dependent oxidoreductase [Candidatus Latescibacterota bacterium]